MKELSFYEQIKSKAVGIKPDDKRLSPIGAYPKSSKGDYPKARGYIKATKEMGKIFKKKIPIRKNGSINIAELKRLQDNQK